MSGYERDMLRGRCELRYVGVFSDSILKSLLQVVPHQYRDRKRRYVISPPAERTCNGLLRVRGLIKGVEKRAPAQVSVQAVIEGASDAPQRHPIIRLSNKSVSRVC